MDAEKTPDKEIAMLAVVADRRLRGSLQSARFVVDEGRWRQALNLGDKLAVVRWPRIAGLTGVATAAVVAGALVITALDRGPRRPPLPTKAELEAMANARKAIDRDIPPALVAPNRSVSTGARP